MKRERAVNATGFGRWIGELTNDQMFTRRTVALWIKYPYREIQRCGEAHPGDVGNGKTGSHFAYAVIGF